MLQFAGHLLLGETIQQEAGLGEETQSTTTSFTRYSALGSRVGTDGKINRMKGNRKEDTPVVRVLAWDSGDLDSVPSSTTAVLCDPEDVTEGLSI